MGATSRPAPTTTVSRQGEEVRAKCQPANTAQSGSEIVRRGVRRVQCVTEVAGDTRDGQSGLGITPGLCQFPWRQNGPLWFVGNLGSSYVNLNSKNFTEVM